MFKAMSSTKVHVGFELMLKQIGAKTLRTIQRDEYYVVSASTSGHLNAALLLTAKILMEDLPQEIQKIIAAFAPDAEKRQLRLASTKWFKLVDYRTFTIYFPKLSKWPQIVDRIRKYQPTSLQLLKSTLRTPDILEHLTRLTSLEYFTHSGSAKYSSFGIDWQGFTVMTNLKQINGFNGIPNDILKKFPQLETLRQFGVNYATLINDVHCLTNLCELEARTNDENITPFAVITEAHSKLTSLDLLVESVSAWTDADLQRLKNIKRLYLHLYDKRPKEEMAVLSLKHLTALEELDTQFQITEVSSTNLRRLKMEHITEAEKRLFPFMGSVEQYGTTAEENMDYLTSLTRLVSIVLRDRKNMDDDQKYSILGNMSSKLTYMSLEMQARSVDFRYLTQFGSIRELNLYNTICDDNITALTNLEILSIESGEEGYDDALLLTSLSKLTTLRSLSYINEKVEVSNVDLSPLTNLEDLWLTDMEQFTGLETLTNLTGLGLRGSPANFRNLPFLEKMTNLVNLRVLLLDSDALQHVTALTKLKELYIYKCHNDEELQSLTALNNLTLFGVDITNSTHDSLLARLNLHLQELSWPNLSRAEVKLITMSLPYLCEFYYEHKY